MLVQIRCEGVDYESNTYDPFLDLSLEINKASSVKRALQHFTMPEVLDGDNKYRCPKNNKLVRCRMHQGLGKAPGHSFHMHQYSIQSMTVSDGSFTRKVIVWM